jgi:hypothetical protein
MMLRISMDVEAGSKAVKEGVIPKLLQQTNELIKPEASYFTADHGRRTAYFFFDMKESSVIPQISEPWFAHTNAQIDYQPVMNGEELRVGLERITKR